MKENLCTKYFPFTYNDITLNKKATYDVGKSPHIFFVIGGVECIMNGIVLCLILHIFTGTKDTNSSKKETELKYKYLIW